MIYYFYKNIRNYICATIALSFTIFIVSCGKAEDSSSTKDILYVSAATARSLDPHDTADAYEASVEHAMYEGLLSLNKNLKIFPKLAEKYTFNDTATEFEFTLRKNIKFHDGTPFNAEAVKVNIDRLMTKKYKKSYLMDPVKEFQVIDDYTVKFILKNPFGAFLNTLTHSGAHIISPAALEKYKDDIFQNPVGTGPFLLDEWVQGSFIRIKKNPNYWGEKAKVDTITFQSIPEDGARLAMLRAGKADFIYPMPAELISMIKSDPNIDVIQQPSLIQRYLVFNTKYKPLSDVRVRQAINYALDKKAFIHLAWSDSAKEAQSIFPQDLPYYKSQGTWPYDLEKAKQLMKEAGYENGFKVVFFSPDISRHLRLIEMVQQQLAEIEIYGDIEIADFASFYAYLQTYRVDDPDLFPFIAFSGWSASIVDANWAVHPILSTSAFPPHASNFGFFSDPKVDALVADGLSSADSSVREKIYFELQDYIWKKAPWGYLFVDIIVTAKSKNVSGIYFRADGKFDVTHAALTVKK